MNRVYFLLLVCTSLTGCAHRVRPCKWDDPISIVSIRTHGKEIVESCSWYSDGSIRWRAKEKTK